MKMKEEQRTILSLDSDAVMNLMLKNEQYCNFELPEYFNFEKLLEHARQVLGDSPADEVIANRDALMSAHLNVEFLKNKDGKYGVRPFTLTNPYLYYLLVRSLCGAASWPLLQGHFEACQVPGIKVCAIPVVPQEREPFANSTQILNWWNSMEQRSIELAMQYRYMFVTDLTNCYGTINLDSIGQALQRRGTQRLTGDCDALAGEVTQLLRHLRHGQNIGVPQGSVVYDLVAEVVLCYADLLLHETLEGMQISSDSYTILRYRDDYRVFCNSESRLEQISYALQSVLEQLNFRMNVGKTRIATDLISASIKPDKLYLMGDVKQHYTTVQKQLVAMLLFGRKFPNSGQLKRMFNTLDKRVKSMAVNKPMKLAVENFAVLASLLVHIAVENVTSAHYALRTLSLLLRLLGPEKSPALVQQVYDRLIQLPNGSYTQLWLQHLTLAYHDRDVVTGYTMPLCQVVDGELDELWNNDWLAPEFNKPVPVSGIFDKDSLEACGGVIRFKARPDYDEEIEPEDEPDEEDGKEQEKSLDEKVTEVIDDIWQNNTSLEDMWKKRYVVCTFPYNP